MSRYLLVSPGQTHSTADIYDGIRAALIEAGEGVGTYALTQRIRHAQECLMLRKERSTIEVPEPTWEEVLYHASQELLAAALRYDVDWVLFVSCGLVPHEVYVLLRKAGLRTAVLLTESPYEDERQAQVAPLLNVCFTNERTSIERLRRANPNTFYLRHAYDPAHHSPEPSDLDDVVPAHDVVFVGTLWQERIDLLEQVDWRGIDLGLYGEQKWLPADHPLWHYVRGEHVDNAHAAALYRKAKVCLNLYRESAFYTPDAPRVLSAESVNPRAMELAACGAFQISQPRAEQDELFGSSIPTFRTAADLEALVQKALAEPTWRQTQADRARHAVEGETFAARVAQLTAILAPIHSGKETSNGSQASRSQRGNLHVNHSRRRANQVGVASRVESQPEAGSG